MDKLSLIREQKQELRKKIIQLQGQNTLSPQLTEEKMAILYEKKKKIQSQRLQQQKYRKMQQQYIQHKKQMQREKDLQRIKNQKRLIELQVGMKKIVLNSVQQKVKGINSDQLFTRALLNQQEQNKQLNQNPAILKYKSKLDIKNQFQKYLINQDIKKQKQKYDLYSLNQKRFQLFQKKQELIMRELLLKQIMNTQNDNNNSLNDQEEDIDAMTCPKEQLQALITQLGYDVSDYLHPIDPKTIATHYKNIQPAIRQKIMLKREQLLADEKQAQQNYSQKQQLRKWIQNYSNQQSILQMKSLLIKLIDDIVYDYEKRHFPLTEDEKESKLNYLQKQYARLQEQTLNQQVSKLIVDDMQVYMLQQLVKQSTEEVSALQEMAIANTDKSFDWLFTKQNYRERKLGNQPSYKSIKLMFTQNSDTQQYGGNDPFKILNNSSPSFSNNQNNKENIFETQKFTSQLINDIGMLALEQKYFSLIEISVRKQHQNHDQRDFRLFFEPNSLYIISSKCIKQVIQTSKFSDQSTKATTLYKTIMIFNKQIKQIKCIKKLNNNFIIQNKQCIYIFTLWNHQNLPYLIGERINNGCGMLMTCEIYPVFSLLGSLCSLLIGFQKGQVLKYNFNRNRITNEQTNISHYIPLGSRIKTGEQPSFPLNNKNIIQYKTQKAKQFQQPHEFRQFFDHHISNIVNISYYHNNMFIVVDKNLKCSIWSYDEKKGAMSYEPVYTFQIVSSYKIYKESESPKFKDLYPSSNITQSPQDLYKKWMQHETFLKLQIYNNPKKNSAFFKSPKSNEGQSQQAIWKISYDDSSKKINHIYQTFYNVADGKIQCKEARVWREYVILLVEREHAMRNDLKTMKIYFWSIEEKKLRTVAIDFDIFNAQKFVPFIVIEHETDKHSFPIISVISSGKILLFSILSGQLLKDICQQPSCLKVKEYNFMNMQPGLDNIFYANTIRNITEFILNNKNSKKSLQQFNQMIEISRKKYNNII